MIQTSFEIKKNMERWAVAALLILGFILRLACIGSLPYGLNQDEASAGYDAWALLNYGIDRNGNTLPALFVSWGSGQNVLMSYLAMPFMALLGPSELALRLPNAIFGCLSLAAFWLMARRAGGRGLGLCALLVMALNPWQIMSCRWALESNLFPSLLIIALLFTSMAKERPWMLLPAAAVLALSLYAYGTAFFFLPLFLIGALIWLGRDLKPWPTVASALVFVLIALPITICQLINVMGLEQMELLGITLPRLTEARQAATSVLGGGSVVENLRTLFKLLWTQSDGLPYNSMGIWQGGIFYFFGLPTAIIGFAVSLGRRRDREAEAPVRIALISALVCALLIRGNINRINMLWPPLIYFSALGVYVVLCKLKRWGLIPLAAILACFAVFSSAYANEFGGEGNINYYPGLGQAIEYAGELDVEAVYVTNYVNQPYIFALYYTETAPGTFLRSVEYRDPDAAFRQVERFEGFEFSRPEDCDAAVLGYWETGEREILARFGKFCVCGSVK